MVPSGNRVQFSSVVLLSINKDGVSTVHVIDAGSSSYMVEPLRLASSSLPFGMTVQALSPILVAPGGGVTDVQLSATGSYTAPWLVSTGTGFVPMYSPPSTSMRPSGRIARHG